MGKDVDIEEDDPFERWFTTMYGKGWLKWKPINKGEWPELTDQLLEAEVEARKEVNSDKPTG